MPSSLNIDYMKTGPKKRCAYDGHATVVKENESEHFHINFDRVPNSVVHVLGLGRMGRLKGKYVCSDRLAFGKAQVQLRSSSS